MARGLLEGFDAKSKQNENTFFNSDVIQVYVENEEDVPFWKYFFNKKNLKTKISPSSRGIIERGKDSVLSYLNNVGKYLILCVDSDFDYLFHNATKRSEIVNTNPYVFHTYLHSIESYKCYAETLNNVIIEATLNDNEIFDCVDFLNNFSKIIYNLFIHFIYYEKNYEIKLEKFKAECVLKQNELLIDDFYIWKSQNQPTQIFSLKNGFNKNIELKEKTIDISTKGKNELLEINEKVKQTLLNLPKIEEEKLNQIKNDLLKLGVNENNTYLFIQGHALMDEIVLKFLNPIFKHLENEYSNIFDEAKKEIEEERKLENITRAKNHYKKIVYTNNNDKMSTIERILFNHKFFEKCEFANKIMEDIDIYINNNLN